MSTKKGFLGLDKKGLCLPLMIYAALSSIALINTLFSNQKGSMRMFLVTLVSVIFWSFIMYELCKNSREGWAWVLLLLPFVLVILGVIIILIINKGVLPPLTKVDDDEDQ